VNSKDHDRNRELTKDFQKLHEELVKEGFFKPSYIHLAYRLSELLFIAGLSFYLRWNLPSSKLAQVVSYILLGILGGRSGWLMHEGGHHSLTGKPAVDRTLESLVMGKY